MTINPEHKVDKGVPVPVSKGLPLNKLNVGESIQFPLENRGRVATQASILTSKTGKKFTVRKESSDEWNDEETCRIWRIV